jgi:hypothetical protein
MIEQPHPNLGMDPRWVEFYPYKVRIEPGESVTFQLRVTNHEGVARRFSAQLRSVEGVRLLPERVDREIAAGSLVEIGIEAAFPQSFVTHSLPILADVIWGGRRLGEIAEAIAYW